MLQQKQRHLGWLAGRAAGGPPACLVACLSGWLAHWLAAWLAGCVSAGRLACWPAG